MSSITHHSLFEVALVVDLVPCCRAPSVRAEALDPDNASILVAGGGGVALLVTRKLKDMGSWVWVLQRSDSRRCGLNRMHHYYFNLCGLICLSHSR